MAFLPPVSAISGIGAPSGEQPAPTVALDQPGDLGRAGEHDAGNVRVGAPARRRHRRRRAGTAARLRGTPASCRMRTMAAAISGVSSAGLASTGLPATSAAAIWPVKIASGKFHGLMQTMGPSGLCVGAKRRRPGRRNSAGNRWPRALRRWRCGTDLAGLAHDQAQQFAACAACSRSAARAQACARARVGGGPARAVASAKARSA